jgi:integrase
MVRAHLKGVNTSTKRLADGTLRRYYYHRATGQRLRGKPGLPDFISDYAAAEKLIHDRHAGTLTGLIRDYCLSLKFEGLADSTKTEYRRMLTKIEAKFGDMPTAALEVPRVRRHFMEWHEQTARQSGAREADNRMSVLSAVLTWAKRKSRIGENHVAGFERLHSADRSDMIWLPEHIAAIEARAPEEVRRAMVLALHTGQRQADLLALTWSNISISDDGQFWITLRQGKTKRRVAIPATETLKAELSSWERKGAVILMTKTGQPWKSRHFKAEWKRASDAAGIADLHFNDLRGTAVTMLAEAGCTTAEIASISGHSQRTAESILDRYLARTSVLAGNAIARLENARRTKFANQVQTGGASTERGPTK